jgi:hypothetical protein
MWSRFGDSLGDSGPESMASVSDRWFWRDFVAGILPPLRTEHMIQSTISEQEEHNYYFFKNRQWCQTSVRQAACSILYTSRCGQLNAAVPWAWLGWQSLEERKKNYTEWHEKRRHRFYIYNRIKPFGSKFQCFEVQKPKTAWLTVLPTPRRRGN